MSYIEVGRLNKSFGVKGLIKVIPNSPFKEDLSKSSIWFIKKGSEVVPFFVESIENEPHFLVKFEDVDSPEAARKITGGTLLLREKDISTTKDQAETNLTILKGFMVQNQDEELGKIERIEEFPQQLMAFIASKSGEIMLPLTPEFIINIDTESRLLLVDLPEGLIESQL